MFFIPLLQHHHHRHISIVFSPPIIIRQGAPFPYRNPFLALLGDRSYFPFIRRSENRAQVTYRASLGKPIVSVEVERRSLENLYRISMQEGT